MKPDIEQIHYKLDNDLEYFCANAPLIIKDKDGKHCPLVFNKAQKYIHDRLEAQLKEAGRVRAWIIKGRQQGCTTYIEARFYHKTTRKKGLSAFILSHEAKTTSKIFKLVKRYQDNIHPSLRPSVKYSNSNELDFDRAKSDYYVGTAGSKEVGRGGTIQLFHGSEVGFWINTDEIKAGLLQSVSQGVGSEVIFESTANGMGNMFHQGIMDALKGLTEYQVIFVPWFWQDEYKTEVPDDFIPDEKELEYQEIYALSNEQMFWRRNKIKELGEHKFKQEYPATIHEAFQVSGGGLIKPEWIAKARQNYAHGRVNCKGSPLIMGVDPADQGDRTVIAFRRNREFPKIIIYDKMKPMLLAGIIAKLLVKHNVAQCFIDYAHGHAVADRLSELGYSELVTTVHFGERAIEDDLYVNKRAEIWVQLKEWIEREGVSIPDQDDIQADLSCMPMYLETSSSKKKLVDKAKIKQDYGMSPDIGDAMALTFSYPIEANVIKGEIKNHSKALTAIQRRKRRR